MTESYFTGGDALFDLEHPFLIGQTFIPTKDHTLEYIDLNLKRRGPGAQLWITLHDLETDPNMWGGGISYSKRATWADRKWFEITRVRFTMSKQKVKIGKSYGIVVHSISAGAGELVKVQYDQAQATYPGGCRFTKNGLLDPPAWYYGSDLMFAEFGPPPPEPPPYEPPIDKYAITDIKQYDTGLGIRLVVTTNVPCHLWMVWTNQEPWKHLIHGQRRGAWVVREVRFCFVDFHANEQLEAGDTLIHTFVKEPWEICETRWFTFKGKVGDYFTTSASAIWAKHRIGPPGIPACYSWDLHSASWNWGGSGREVSTGFKPCRAYLTDRLTIGLASYPPNTPPTSARLSIYAADGFGKPLGEPLRTGIVSIDPPAPPAYHKYTAYFEPIALDLDGLYAYAVTAPHNYSGDPILYFRIAGDNEQTCLLSGNYHFRLFEIGGWEDWVKVIDPRHIVYEVPELL